MKSYELVKCYPGSLEVGSIVKDNGTGVYFQKGNNLDTFSASKIEGYPEFWQEVKEKDYEILSVIGNSNHHAPKTVVNQMKLGGYPNLDKHAENIGWDILSVKRISDGEIFNVGDNFMFDTNSPSIKEIIDFKISNNTIDVGYYSRDKYYYKLNGIKKAKQKLFTTENGVDIFEGDDYFYISTEHWITVNINHSKSIDLSSTFKAFSTKEAAEEYIEMNKPKFSLEDVRGILCMYAPLDLRFDDIINSLKDNKL